MRRLLSMLALLAPCAGSASARADAPPEAAVRTADPARIAGIERPASAPDDPARALASAVLYAPREMVNLVFLATGSAAGMLQDQQIVPRVAELVSPRQGAIGVFPTAFAETGRPLNVGVRMIGNLGSVATTLRAGYGGPDDVVTAGRIRFTQSAPFATTIDLEGQYDRRSDLDYVGVGQMPETDARNRFASGGGPRESLYLARRSRMIVDFGLRPSDDVEVFLSTSLALHREEDSPGAGSAALSRVFVPGSVPGAFSYRRVVYSELALRLDTRASRARPSPGWLVEAYAGPGRGIAPDATAFLRAGGRAAAFFPVLHRYNILSPKLVLDGIAPIGDAPLPFAELAGQPDFRGLDDRRDRVSLVASLDYRWAVTRFLAARVFGDLATVGPSVSDLDLGHLRGAAGFGVDLSSASSEIGQLAVAASPDGARLMLSLGVASVFGDRQHRD